MAGLLEAMALNVVRLPDGTNRALARRALCKIIRDRGEEWTCSQIKQIADRRVWRHLVGCGLKQSCQDAAIDRQKELGI